MSRAPAAGNGELKAQTSKNGDRIDFFDPRRIRPFPGQPRKRFPNIAGLATSIRTAGQSTPIVVKPVDDDPNYDVELIDGERRLRAGTLIVEEHDPSFKLRAWVRTDITNTELQYDASVAANFNKVNHDTLEVAHVLKRFKDRGWDTRQIADFFGMSDAWVYQHLSILKLHRAVQALLVPSEDEESEENEDGIREPVKQGANGQRVRRGSRKLSLASALLLVNLPEMDQIEVARHISDKNLSQAEVRRHILQLGSEKNIKVNKRPRGPKHQQRSFRAHLKAANQSLGVFFDMRRGEVEKMFANVKKKDREEITEEIYELIGGLEAVAKILDPK